MKIGQLFTDQDLKVFDLATECVHDAKMTQTFLHLHIIYKKFKQIKI
jgi:hypothetical protein